MSDSREGGKHEPGFGCYRDEREFVHMPGCPAYDPMVSADADGSVTVTPTPRESGKGCTLCAGVHEDTLAEYDGCRGCGRGAPGMPQTDSESPLAEAVRKARTPDPVAWIEAFNRGRAGQ